MATYTFADLGSQSSSEGRDKRYAYTEVIKPAQALEWDHDNTQWVTLEDPTATGKPTLGGASYKPAFCNWWHKFVNPDDIIRWVCVAWGGRGVSVGADNWSNDANNVYINAKARIDAAGGIDGWFFFGGATDMDDGTEVSAAHFTTHFQLLASNCRRDFGADLPIYLGQLGWSPPGMAEGRNELINGAIQALPDVIDNCYLTEASSRDIGFYCDAPTHEAKHIEDLVGEQFASHFSTKKTPKNYTIMDLNPKALQA